MWTKPSNSLQPPKNTQQILRGDPKIWGKKTLDDQLGWVEQEKNT